MTRQKQQSLNRRNVARFSDGVRNSLLRIGEGTPNTFNATHYVPQFTSLNRVALEWMYQGSWICGLAVDIPAEDMTREGIEVKCDDVTLNRDIDAEFDRYRVWSSLDEAIKWSRLYGGAIAAIMIDGADMSQPLGDVAKGTFRGLYVFDRWQIEPSIELVQDLGPDFGKPVFYRVIDEQCGIKIKGDRIHHSRVIRLEGVKMPHFIRRTYQGWGASILERIAPRVAAFDLASEGAAQLVSKAHLRYYKIQGLRDILTNGLARKGFLAQMDAVREFQGIEGMTLGDKEDDFQTFSYSFTGLPEILLQFGQQISGAIGIPLVRLFGQSPTGFNATGESDLRIYYDNVKKQQDNALRPGIKRLLSVIYQSLKGERPQEEVAFEFNPLWQMSNEQKSTVASSMTGAVSTALNDGIISPATAMKELRKLSETVGLFSSITDEEIEEAEQADEAAPPPGADMGGMGGMNGSEEGAAVPGANGNGGDRPMVPEKAPAAGQGSGPNRQ